MPCCDLPSSQAPKLIITSALPNHTRPSTPTCTSNTHASHTTVAYIGNAITCLNVTSHGPGLGRRFNHAGNHDSST